MFFHRSGHFLTGGRILGKWFFCNSVHIFLIFCVISPVRPVQRPDEQPEAHRISPCDFSANSILLILRAKKLSCLLCAPTGRSANAGVKLLAWRQRQFTDYWDTSSTPAEIYSKRPSKRLLRVIFHRKTCQKRDLKPFLA